MHTTPTPLAAAVSRSAFAHGGVPATSCKPTLFTFCALLTMAAMWLPAISRAQVIKWNPGHYVRFQGDTPTTTTIGNANIGSPALKGVVVRMRWNQLEGATQGDYSPLDQTGPGTIHHYLSYLEPLGRHLIIDLRERNYTASSTNNNDAVPAYLMSSVIQGSSQSIWLPDYGSTFVRDRYIALAAAIASRFDTHPNFEGFQSGEQATYGLANSTWRQHFTDMAVGAKNALVRSMFWATTPVPSSMTSTQLNTIFVTAQAGQYLIDTPPHEYPNNPDAWSLYAMANAHQFPVKTNGEVAAWNSPSGTDDDDPDYYYQVAVNQVYAHHVTWTHSASKLRAGWWTDVLAYLENGGSPLPANLQVPASITGIHAPSNLATSSPAQTQLTLTWTDNSYSETGFVIDRATNSSFTSGYVGSAYTAGAGATSVTATGLTAGTTYYFRMRSRNTSVSPMMVSANSNTASGTTQATATFYSIAGEDGDVLESTETSNVGGGFTLTGATVRTGDQANDRQYKAILSFDTSSLPDGATIVSATLRVRRNGVTGTSPYTTHGQCRVDIKNYNFNSNVALEDADFQAAANATNVAQLPDVANGAWSAAALNAAGVAQVNKLGRTQFRLYFATDDNDDSGADYITWHAGEAAAGSRPELVVVYQ